jgi:hypothetical protein
MSGLKASTAASIRLANAAIADRARLHTRCRPVKGQAVDRFDRGRRNAVTRAGHRRDRPPQPLLRLEDRPRAERVATLQRQAVIEDMKDTHRGARLPQIA